MNWMNMSNEERFDWLYAALGNSFKKATTYLPPQYFFERAELKQVTNLKFAEWLVCDSKTNKLWNYTLPKLEAIYNIKVNETMPVPPSGTQTTPPDQQNTNPGNNRPKPDNQSPAPRKPSPKKAKLNLAWLKKPETVVIGIIGLIIISVIIYISGNE